MKLKEMLDKIHMLEQSITQSTRPESIYAKSMLMVAEVMVNQMILSTELVSELRKISEQLSRGIELLLQRQYPAEQQRSGWGSPGDKDWPNTLLKTTTRYGCRQCGRRIERDPLDGNLWCECVKIAEGGDLPGRWYELSEGEVVETMDPPGKTSGVSSHAGEGSRGELPGSVVDADFEPDANELETGAAEPADEDQTVDTHDPDVSTSGVNQADVDGLGEFDETPSKE